MPRIGRRFIIAGVAALGCTLAAGCSSPSPDMTVHGTVVLALQEFTEIDPGTVGNVPAYTAVWQGNGQVAITDPSGNVLATVRADGSIANQPNVPGVTTIAYGWTAKVPEGQASYSLSVPGISGHVDFTQAEMQAGPSFCVGDDCSAVGGYTP